MSPEDVDLNQQIKEAEDTLQSLYVIRRARYRAQLRIGMSYRKVGAYWGVTGASIQHSLDAPGTPRYKAAMEKSNV